MAKQPLDDQIDQLYQLPLEEFTAARNALAKDQRRERGQETRETQPRRMDGEPAVLAGPQGLRRSDQGRRTHAGRLQADAGRQDGGRARRRGDSRGGAARGQAGGAQTARRRRPSESRGRDDAGGRNARCVARRRTSGPPDQAIAADGLQRARRPADLGEGRSAKAESGAREEGCSRKKAKPLANGRRARRKSASSR